ncbi:MAG: glycosyltransferase family 2 protein [Bacteroidota bacterium]
MPLFSIVIPTFNRSAFIGNTVRSVLCQSLQNFEIIIVDDGSTDDTSFKLKDLLEVYKDKIIYIYQQNKERGNARNVGIRRAKGTYVVFLDSDDLMQVNHLFILNQQIQLQSDLTFIATKFEIRSLRTGEILSIPLNKFQQGFYDYKCLLDGNHFACNFVVRKDKLAHLFEEDRAYASVEDWIFLMRNLQAHQIFLIDKLTITMIDHDGRSMKDHPVKIERKLNTAAYLLERMRLTNKEQKKLLGYAYYHASIHAYLMFNRMEAVKLIRKSIFYLGVNGKIALLTAKSFIGKRIVNFIKPYLQKSTKH